MTRCCGYGCVLAAGLVFIMQPSKETGAVGIAWTPGAKLLKETINTWMKFCGFDRCANEYYWLQMSTQTTYSHFKHHHCYLFVVSMRGAGAALCLWHTVVFGHDPDVKPFQHTRLCDHPPLTQESKRDRSHEQYCDLPTVRFTAHTGTRTKTVTLRESVASRIKVTGVKLCNDPYRNLK